MSNSSYYSGGVATVAIDDAITIVVSCMIAGTPDRIVDFLAMRLTPEQVKERLTAAPAPSAANTSTKAPANIFGGPTPAERDKLAVALQRRMEQVYPPKRAP